jgi:hypothetical protein
MDIARRLFGLIGERGRVLGGRIADILLCDTRLGVQCFFAVVLGECIASAVGVDTFF